MGMGFAPTWLRQVSPPALQNHWPHPLRGRFIFHTMEGSVLRLGTKFEVDRSIRSIVIKGVPKFGN